MQELLFDTGLQEYKMPGGILRMNPQDPNLYQRFLDASPKIAAVEEELTAKGKALENTGEADSGQAIIGLLTEMDRRAKGILNEVFGCGNDFDALMNGVNLLAVANNGERVITNLMAALKPVLEQGAEACAETMAESAVNEARKARERRTGRDSAVTAQPSF